jgi:hypothetical protein
MAGRERRPAGAEEATPPGNLLLPGVLLTAGPPAAGTLRSTGIPRSIVQPRGAADVSSAVRSRTHRTCSSP